MPQISVIVPVYKVEPYLRRCVDSILAQSFRDFELILVDDGSPDQCGAICDEYAVRDSRVHVIHQENGGLSAARNAGIDWAFANSDSRWLNFVDSDDYVLPEYLETLFFAVTDYGADISICGEFKHTGEENPTAGENFAGQQVVTSESAITRIYTGLKGHASYVSAWAKLYRKTLFREIRYPKGRLHEDQYTTYRVMYQAEKIVEDGRKLYGYFVNANGITHSNFADRRYDDIDACDQAIAFFKERNDAALQSAAEHRRSSLIAKYSVMARKAGIYSQVSKPYRMSVLSAYRKLVLLHGQDYGEYFMAQYYPVLVKLLSYLRKITKK